MTTAAEKAQERARREASSAVHVTLLAILRERGPLTDEGLYSAYVELNAGGALPRQSRAAIVRRRLELLATGKVVPRWEAVE